METLKINYIDIAGTKYPMSFSLAAAKTFKNRFGSLSKMFEEMSSGDDAFDQLDVIIFVLETLIMQGCAYMNIFGKNLPVVENSCFNGEEYKPLSHEMIEIAIGINNMGDVSSAIVEAIGGSSEREIEVEENGDEKNAPALAETAISGLTVGAED